MNDHQKNVRWMAVLAKLLGLENPFEYAEANRHRVQAKGRTTRMLLAALANMAQGRRVVLVAYGAVYAHTLKARLRGWAEQVGIDPELAKEAHGRTRETEQRLQGKYGRVVFDDHFDPEWEYLLARHRAQKESDNNALRDS